MTLSFFHQRLSYITAAALLIAGCTQTNPPYVERMVVYALLDPGLAHQTVVVDRTYRVDEAAPDSSGVSGARVAIVRDASADTLLLPESERPGFYRDTSLLPFLTANSSVQLHVDWQGYSGSVRITVPDRVSFYRPVSGETLSATHPPVFSWTHVQGAGRYAVYGGDPILIGTDSLYLPLLTQDTELTPGPGFFTQIGRHSLRLYALNDRLANRQGTEMDTIGVNVIANIGAQSADSIYVLVVP